MDANAFWQDVLSKNREALPRYFCDDAVICWHCTNEQFTVAEYISANCDYPGEWSGEIQRLEERENLMILVGRVYPPDKSASFHVVSFIGLRAGKIRTLDEYWADDGSAPAWRQKMRIGKPIR